MIEILTIKLKSYNYTLIDKAALKIMEIVKVNNIKSSGPIPLPVKREIITILRSPHRHKDSREQFERCTYSRLIKIFKPNNKIIRDFIYLSLPIGVKSQIKEL